MKKSIEEIIKTNRSFFDSEMPEKGHFEKFYLRLENTKPVRTSNLRVLTQIAAVLIIGIISATITLTLVNQSFKGRSGATLNQVSPELAETELYYQTEINAKKMEIKSLSIDSVGQKDMVFNDINEMDKSFKSLSNELKKHPYDERVISAMIEHYQLQLDILNQVIHNLRQAAVLSRKNPSSKNKPVVQLL